MEVAGQTSDLEWKPEALRRLAQQQMANPDLLTVADSVAKSDSSIQKEGQTAAPALSVDESPPR
ncbi:MAG: hypothetical protein CMB49_07310 [Euryarchaeota archaeon]|nr:hypothetical protein [Euryarchaeota archaeon]MBK30492.1 hypothetical protein [Euryarchaeota archaeon]